MHTSILHRAKIPHTKGAAIDRDELRRRRTAYTTGTLASHDAPACCDGDPMYPLARCPQAQRLRSASADRVPQTLPRRATTAARSARPAKRPGAQHQGATQRPECDPCGPAAQARLPSAQSTRDRMAARWAGGGRFTGVASSPALASSSTSTFHSEVRNSLPVAHPCSAIKERRAAATSVVHAEEAALFGRRRAQRPAADGAGW